MTNHKPINKIHILAMARHAGLAIQDDNAFFLNDLASEKELLAFARLIERAIHQDHGAPSDTG